MHADTELPQPAEKPPSEQQRRLLPTLRDVLRLRRYSLKANTGHPASDTFTLARASDSRVAALGVSWADASGRNNAQYAPFAWRNA